MVTLSIPMAPVSEESQRLLDVLKEGGVDVVDFDDLEDAGISVTWMVHGQRHASGGPTLEEALAYIVFHMGLGR